MQMAESFDTTFHPRLGSGATGFVVPRCNMVAPLYRFPAEGKVSADRLGGRHARHAWFEIIERAYI
mgnify:CR=1 FL=1